ncbi:MAG TPA: ABC transporter permease [Gemmatimonadaceae bacterium]|nr:ABC transporter permease [Gemmatimonadaceae bacterium]
MLLRLRTDVREMLAEMLEYRELLYSMARRDLLLRYKQTAMGFAWAFFMPVLNMIIFSVIFTRVTKLNVNVPYPIYAYAGLLPWSFLASSLRFSVISLTGNIPLVTKVYFPREVFPFAAILVSLVDFAVGATFLAALMVYYGIGVSWAILFLPVVLLVQVVFIAGMALLLSMSNLYFRDVKYIFEVVVTVWMFATSVVYPVQSIGGRLGAILALNPMTPIIEAYRAVLLHGTLPDPEPFLLAAALSCVVFAVGWLTFHRAEFQFAERI